MHVNCKQIILGLFLIFNGIVLKGQNRIDTISNLTKMSKKYVDLMFNKQRFDSVSAYWTKDVFGDLSVGYNNGKIQYSNEKDLLILFTNDMKTFLKDFKEPFRFIQSDPAILIEDDYGVTHFIIDFKANNKVEMEDDLKSISIDFISKDQGMTWVVNTDYWIKRFMHFKYPPGGTMSLFDK